MSKLRGIKVELDAGIVEGPRGLSIGKILFKEKLENGNNVYDVFLENGEIIGQLISDKGDRGDKGDKGDVGRGIVSVTKARKVDLMTYYEILYSDFTTEEFAVEDGQNSYELWLGLGNEGTLEEFLEHFRGYSIKNITFREVLPDGNYAHDVFLESGEKIGEVISPKGQKGDSFYIKKVYPSTELMEADFSNEDVGIGEYVIISSNDDDNGKLFEKRIEGFYFIIDMSISIKNISLKETLPNGDKVYSMFLENGEKIGEFIASKGDIGPQGPPGVQGPQGLTVNEYNSNKWISGNEGYDSILVVTFTQNFSIATYQNRCSFLLVVTVEIQNLDNLNETILTGTNIFLINAPVKVASKSYSNSPTSPEMKLKVSIVAMTFDMDIGFIEGSYGLGAKIYIKESSQTQRKRYSFSIIPFDKESKKIENNGYSTSFYTTRTNRYDKYIKHYSANVIV